jgi:hypothetical protein
MVSIGTNTKVLKPPNPTVDSSLQLQFWQLGLWPAPDAKEILKNLILVMMRPIYQVDGSNNQK